MITAISREYWFSAAHRLEGHPKCGRLHGHNYRVVVTLFGVPDERGMVMDYGDLDKVVKPFINESLDHKYLVSQSNLEQGDPVAPIAIRMGWAYSISLPASTGEYIAQLISEAIHNLPNTVIGLQVQVDETPKSTAVYPVKVR